MDFCENVLNRPQILLGSASGVTLKQTGKKKHIQFMKFYYDNILWFLSIKYYFKTFFQNYTQNSSISFFKTLN